MARIEKPRIGVVAADPLRSVGLVAILEEVVDLQAVTLDLEGAFADADLAALLMDVRLPLEVLTDLIARLRRERPGVKVIIMGEPLDPDSVQAVIAAGGKGYLNETASESEIRTAMEIVLDGSVWAPRKVLARLIEAGGIRDGVHPPPLAANSLESKLTPREGDVLRQLMDGHTNRDIAKAMGVDEVTVKAHLGRMLRKSGATNRVELTLRAMEERTFRSR